MVGDKPASGVIYGPFEGINPGVAGLEDCESSFTHLKAKKMAAEKYRVRHFASNQQASGEGDLGNAYWLPGRKTRPTDLPECGATWFPP